MNMARAIRPGSVLRRSAKGNMRRESRRRFRFVRFAGWLLGLALTAALVAALSVALLAGFRWLTTSSYFALGEIRVQGTTRLTAQEVVDRAGVGIGGNLLDLKIAEIEQRVAADPWVKTVSVRRLLPGGLAITVVEHEPRYWVRAEHGLLYCDARGVAIAPLGVDRFTSLPLLAVESGAREQLDGLEERLELLDGVGLPASTRQAAQISVNADGLEVFYDEQRLRILLDFEEFETNVRKLGLIWNDLGARGEQRRTRRIEISDGKAWVRS